MKALCISNDSYIYFKKDKWYEVIKYSNNSSLGLELLLIAENDREYWWFAKDFILEKDYHNIEFNKVLDELI